MTFSVISQGQSEPKIITHMNKILLNASFNLLLPPATKLRQGNVFTPVCHSVHRGGGVCLPQVPGGGRADPPGRHPPAQCMLGYGQQAGGTDPTGMHSCWTCRSTHVDLFFVWFAHVMGMQHLPTFCLFTQEVIF